jgi:hypothetical protein
MENGVTQNIFSIETKTNIPVLKQIFTDKK